MFFSFSLAFCRLDDLEDQIFLSEPLVNHRRRNSLPKLRSNTREVNHSFE